MGIAAFLAATSSGNTAAGGAAIGGFIVVNIARAVWRSTPRGRVGAQKRARERAEYRQQHPPSAEIARRWIDDKLERREQR